MYNAEQLAELLGIPESTLDTWRGLRIGPPAVRIAGRTTYLRSEYVAWVAAGGPLSHGIELGPLPSVADDAPLSVLLDGHRQQLGA